ncbi:alpha/beta hydrolase [Actinoplanes sp. NBRC 101535]|uniref:alpha/beta fold hydrolase n=1 Tax=Actinoplanes sp. NBRC 101535 TaxID=3032196 RepID=UPI0025560C00|nr:alpha/beta hydrolase [Actinoplanes sp. NBRC 101535]
MERFVESGAVRIWTERAGDPGCPAVLLIAGSAAQGVSWPDALVGGLVARGVQVIRFDHRDTGRSSVVDFDADPYTIGVMARDCLAVLDGHGIASAHVVGASLGGVLAQWLAVHAPARVRSLTLLATTPMGSRRDGLPPPAPEFLAHLAAGLPPGVESDVALFRVFNGAVRPFDEPAARAMLELARSRAGDPAAAAHHDRAAWRADPSVDAPLASIVAPTTILHGDQDPVFSLGHGTALAAAIPGAVLHLVPGMGHVLTSPGLPEEIAGLIRLARSSPSNSPPCRWPRSST